MLSRRHFLERLTAVSVCTWSRMGRSLGFPTSIAIIESDGNLELRPDRWKSYGRIVLKHLPGSVIVQDGFAVESCKWSNCVFSFEARAPKEAEQVQIWAAIKCRDRDCRYVFALRGGNNDDMYVARYGPDGAAKFFGINPLGHHPEPGVWYRIKAVACENRLLIYLNDEELPRLNVVDIESPWNEGGVSIGGGWLPAEYRNISVRKLSASEELSVVTTKDRTWQPPVIDKGSRRRQQRAAYNPIEIADSGQPREEYSLNGNWLFLPDQELLPNTEPQSTLANDTAWHVMDVPNFWVPTVSWLHGETSFTELSGVSETKGICDRFYEAELERLDGYTFDWQQTKSAWYRQYIDLPALAPNRRYEICFEAVAKISDVWLNGLKVGSHTGMFGELRCDVTQALKPGRNTLAVHVQTQWQGPVAKNNVVGVAVTVEVTDAMLNSLPHGMYRNDAGGIWQSVKFVATNDVRIDDVYIRPHLQGMEFDVSILNETASTAQIAVEYTIRSASDNSILCEDSNAAALSAGSGLNTIHLSTPILKPKLWSPHEPNLYQLEVTIKSSRGIKDRRVFTCGFRTFSVEKGKLLLNGEPFWLRGANHFPNALRPNDTALAKRFMQLAKAGNVSVTRSHTVPFSNCWLDAADQEGVAVSFEGTWPWLMLRGPVPSDELLNVWKDEFLSLIRKFRNHPSIILWTINNEMKFEEADRKDPAMLRQKWEVLNDAVRAVRAADPTRPVVCDSSYCRKGVGSEYQDLILRENFDDGDIDDAHNYFGWYDKTFYHFYHGEFGKQRSFPGRPLISQEMSTGYARNDDGHPVRFYLFQHHTPQSLVGNEAYENRDPALFLRRQAFMTKELAETFRRTNREECAGILHFSYVSWFQDVWNADKVRPFPTYYALRLALQPVLVGAELYGRHFYAGTKLQLPVCVVNDAEDRRALRGCKLTWEIREGVNVLAGGSRELGDVPYYSNSRERISLMFPEELPKPRINAELVLRLEANGVPCSENAYEILLAKRSWSMEGLTGPVTVLGLGAGASLPFQARRIESLKSVHADEIVFLPEAGSFLKGANSANELREFVINGGRALLMHAGENLPTSFPDQVKSFRTCPGELVHMHIPESRAFNGIEPLDLAWFEMGDQRVPRACLGAYTLQSGRGDATALAEVVDFHGYLKSASDIAAISGSPLIELCLGKGRIVASEMTLLEAKSDPVADRLLGNLLNALIRNAEL